jgi:hypothetical protein
MKTAMFKSKKWCKITGLVSKALQVACRLEGLDAGNV